MARHRFAAAVSLLLPFVFLASAVAPSEARTIDLDPREIPLGRLVLSASPDEDAGRIALEPLSSTDLWLRIEAVDFTALGDPPETNATNGILAFEVDLVLPEGLIVTDVEFLRGSDGGGLTSQSGNVLTVADSYVGAKGPFIPAEQTPVNVVRLTVLAATVLTDATIELTDAAPLNTVRAPSWTEASGRCRGDALCLHAFAEIESVVVNPSVVRGGAISVGTLKARVRE